MNRSILPILLALAAILSFDLRTEAKEQETYGPYTALERNSEIVKDVKVSETGRIYLLLNPTHKEKEIVLKNSQQFKAGYRNWYNGEKELVSAANQGKAPQRIYRLGRNLGQLHRVSHGWRHHSSSSKNRSPHF